MVLVEVEITKPPPGVVDLIPLNGNVYLGPEVYNPNLLTDVAPEDEVPETVPVQIEHKSFPPKACLSPGPATFSSLHYSYATGRYEP